jgi:hypothetical protein
MKYSYTYYSPERGVILSVKNSAVKHRYSLGDVKLPVRSLRVRFLPFQVEPMENGVGDSTPFAKIKAGANFRPRHLQVMHSGSRRGCSYAARFLAAHLFFIAALIRLRAAGDKWRLTPPFD